MNTAQSKIHDILIKGIHDLSHGNADEAAKALPDAYHLLTEDITRLDKDRPGDDTHSTMKPLWTASQLVNANFIGILAEADHLVSCSGRGNDNSDFLSQKMVEVLTEIYRGVPKHVGLADWFTQVAAFKTNKGQYNEAVRFMGRALVICIEHCGLVHKRTADAHYNLALLFRLMGDFKRSAKEFELAGNIRRTLSGVVSLPVAVTYLGMAVTMQLGGNSLEAYGYLYAAFSVRRRLLGPKAPKVRSSHFSPLPFTSLHGQLSFLSPSALHFTQMSSSSLSFPALGALGALLTGTTPRGALQGALGPWPALFAHEQSRRRRSGGRPEARPPVCAGAL
jgi:hypothetical protein